MYVYVECCELRPENETRLLAESVVKIKTTVE